MVIISTLTFLLLYQISSSYSQDSLGSSNSGSSNDSRKPSRCGFELYRSNQLSTSEDSASGPQRGSNTLQLDRENDWQSIRIHIEYMNIDLSKSQKEYIKRIISGSVKWYENVLKVKPISHKLKLENIDKCVEISIPDKHKTEGEDADIILYASAGRKYSNIVGYADYCVTDSETGQPVAGMLYLDTYAIAELTDEDFYSTSIHEMAHLIGFHPDLFSSYLNSDGKNYTPEEMFISETQNGDTQLKIKTPKVLQKARASFACDSLDGVEIESQGGIGTAGSHWEKRVMNDDFMVADVDINDVIYSDITMALFEDSGWYSIDYSYTTPLLWGYQEGCDFLNKPCISDGKPNFPEYCIDLKKISRCDYKKLHKGTCNITKYYTALPTAYQYFTDKTLGGSDIYLDFCPIVKQSYRGSCRNYENIEAYLNPNYGEEACEECRCVEGTYTTGNIITEHAACHRVECYEDSVKIHIGDQTVVCSFDDEEDKEVDNYKGVVHCKDSKKICDKKPCPNNCSGVGKCVNGLCECPDGRSGVDCGGNARRRILEKEFSFHRRH